MAQLTVAQLIEKLQQHDPNALVSMEGCDCFQSAYDVEVLELSQEYNPGAHVLILNVDDNT